MPGATPREAVESFLRPLRRAVSCITQSVVDVRGGYYPSEKPHSVIIGDGLSVPLAGEGRLKLRFGNSYRVIEASDRQKKWEVSTTGYFYSLVDRTDQEIITYHWHPHGRSPIRYPHLHIGAGAGCQREELSTAHCPTGPISFPEFLRFVIVDFAVEPLRQDWTEMLTEAERGFETDGGQLEGV